MASIDTTIPLHKRIASEMNKAGYVLIGGHKGFMLWYKDGLTYRLRVK